MRLVMQFLLFQARLEIVDLFTDLGDGVLLMRLLEIISGEKLGKPNRLVNATKIFCNFIL